MPEQAARTVSIPATRLRAWIDNFTGRHGDTQLSIAADVARLVASDGAEALVSIPFPPLDPLDRPADTEALVSHVNAERLVGAVLVRRGGYAVGVFNGSELTVSKVGSSYVQGTTKAGGWSQKRYARRRDNQSRKAFDDATEVVVRLLLPYAARLAGVATGGDRTAVATIFADPRLAELRPLLLPTVYPVADPRLRVLQAFGDQFRAVQIGLNELA